MLTRKLFLSWLIMVLLSVSLVFALDKTFPGSKKVHPDLFRALSDRISQAQQKGSQTPLSEASVRVVVHLQDKEFPYLKSVGYRQLSAVQDAAAQTHKQFLSAVKKQDFELATVISLQPSVAGYIHYNALKKLAAMPMVRSIDIDRLHVPFTTEGIALMNVDDVISELGFDGNGISVAVIDSACDYKHAGFGGSASTTVPNDLFVDVYDFSTPDSDPYSNDFNDAYHGTGTSYIVHRTAPGATLCMYQVFPNAYDSVIANAINRAVTKRDDHNIRVISMSLGGQTKYASYCSDSTMKPAVDNAVAADIIVVVASGNNGWTDGISSPACYSNTIAVGAVWDEDGAYYEPFPPANCSDSNRVVNERTCYTSTCSILDIYAPSEEVITPYPGDPGSSSGMRLGGTSSACPYAAGAIAVLLDGDSSYYGDYDAVKTLLHDTGVPVVNDLGYGHNRIDLYAAMDGSGPGPGPGCDGTEQTWNATDVPKSIPDNSSSGVNSTLAISAAGDIDSLTVAVNITHTWRGDLKVKLTSPEGTAVTFSDPSSNDSGDNIVDSFDLTDFNGENISGTWTLNVSDHAGQDTGSLQSWSITACYQETQVPEPTINSFYASPTTITEGDSTTLYWNTTNANYVRINGGSQLSADGSTSVSPTATTSYTLIAYGDGGQTSSQVTITVNEPAQPATVDSFYASPTTITAGGSATLYWGTTNAGYVRINGGSQLSADGSTTVTPSATTTYTLVAYGDGGNDSATTTVTVQSGGGCEPGHFEYQASDVPKNIPDNSSSGITSTLTVPAGVQDISNFEVYVNISHTWKGDLIVRLTSPAGTTYTIHNRSGSSTDNVIGTFSTSVFDNQDAAGTWTLFASDNARYDTGKINSWNIAFDGCEEGGGSTPPSGGGDFDSQDTPISIPDYNSTGITSTINVTSSGAANTVTISVDISHTYIGDLKVTLVTPTGSVILHDREGGSANDIDKTYTINYSGGNPQGNWQLKVADYARYDTGTLNSWSISY